MSLAVHLFKKFSSCRPLFLYSIGKILNMNHPRYLLAFASL
ncbi:hypothetical protein SAMN05192562_1011101 [Kosakonia arachidis]|uniref:Uncharacterized protein n=1 Tax=Kosakonia arachidis TaxID=551989 RepID=A0A1I6ZDJ8_9ENTR|nr:hypothetical protein SAMN05192562_1011101 [Kosakonia arachidis]